MPNRLYNIQLLRAFSIVSVVIFHVYQMTYDSGHLDKTTILRNKDIYFVPISCWLINIAMPLFMSISGFLFYWLLDKGKYATWGEMLKKKAIRLLVPYFTFGVIMMLTTNAYHNPLKIFGAYWHLWFLPVLMWCFIIGYMLKKLMNNTVVSIVILISSFIILHYDLYMPKFLGLHILNHWFFWFVLGCLMAINDKQFKSFFTKTKFHYLCLIVAIVIGLFLPMEYGESYNFVFTFGQTLMVLAVWYITEFLDLNWMKSSIIINQIAWNSFGLYIFHNWIALYLIGNFSKSLFGIEPFAATHPYLYPFIFFITTFLISFLLSWWLRKFKIGRFFLG